MLDAAKVYKLIEDRQDLVPRSPQGRGSGKQTVFALKLGRDPGSIWNIKYRPVSAGFAAQIAAALGVEVEDLLPDEQEAALKKCGPLMQPAGRGAGTGAGPDT